MKTKRTILTSVLLLLCILAFSQVQLVYETNNHLKFNDIQIDGDINAFSEKLVKQGFKITLRNETLSGLEGNLFGKECGVNVYGTEKTNTVYMVIVSFESEKIEWQALKKLYFDLKKPLQTKYGKGTSSETFIAPYIEGDGREKEALRSDKINYITSWKSTGGEIRIYLLPQYNVQIDYLDEANREVYENEVVETEND